MYVYERDANIASTDEICIAFWLQAKASWVRLPPSMIWTRRKDKNMHRDKQINKQKWRKKCGKTSKLFCQKRKRFYTERRKNRACKEKERAYEIMNSRWATNNEWQFTRVFQSFSFIFWCKCSVVWCMASCAAFLYFMSVCKIDFEWNRACQMCEHNDELNHKCNRITAFHALVCTSCCRWAMMLRACVYQQTQCDDVI